VGDVLLGVLPAQQTRLIEIVGVPSAPVALFTERVIHVPGFSLGAALGGFALVHIDARHLGFVGAACELVALTLLLVNQALDARLQSAGAIWTSRPRASNTALGSGFPHALADDTSTALVKL